MITHVGLSLAGRLASGNRTVKDNVMGFMFGLLVSGITFPCVKRTEAAGYNWAVHPRVEYKRTE